MEGNYKFRGKMTDGTAESVNCDGDRWVQGFYVEELRGGTIHPIITDGAFEFEVEKNTVGRYLGKRDKNNTEIYEDDIVKTKNGRLCIVRWFSSDNFVGFDMKPIEAKHECPTEYDLYKSDNLEVVGNIYDNKELLEE